MEIKRLISRKSLQIFRNYHANTPDRCSPKPKPKIHLFVPDVEAAESSLKLFRFLSYVGFATSAIYGAYLWKTMKPPEPMPLIPYEYMYAQYTKPFSFGDGKHTLFFNPKLNYTIDDYEAAIEKLEQNE